MTDPIFSICMLLFFSALVCSQTVLGFLPAGFHQAVSRSTSAKKWPTKLNLSSTTVDYVNGDEGESMFAELENLDVKLEPNELLPAAPALTYKKFLTMQDKRVIVTVRYSEKSALKPYFLTVAKKLKASYADIIIERRILPHIEDEEAAFEVLVDGKVVVGKSKSQKTKVSRVDMIRTRSVFVSMQELDIAIARARRRRRPSTAYGGVPEDSPRLGTLMQQGGDVNGDGSES